MHFFCFNLAIPRQNITSEQLPSFVKLRMQQKMRKLYPSYDSTHPDYAVSSNPAYKAHFWHYPPGEPLATANSHESTYYRNMSIDESNIDISTFIKLQPFGNRPIQRNCLAHVRTSKRIIMDSREQKRSITERPRQANCGVISTRIKLKLLKEPQFAKNYDPNPVDTEHPGCGWGGCY
jgi:hypothetical protein